MNAVEANEKNSSVGLAVDRQARARARPKRRNAPKTGADLVEILDLEQSLRLGVHAENLLERLEHLAPADPDLLPGQPDQVVRMVVASAAVAPAPIPGPDLVEPLLDQARVAERGALQEGESVPRRVSTELDRPPDPRTDLVSKGKRK